MKKIAFVTPWYGDNIPGGAEAATRGITDKLFEAGVDIEIITTTVSQFASDWYKNHYKPGMYKSRVGIPIRRFSVSKPKTGRFDYVNKRLMQGQSITLMEEEVFLTDMINSPDMYEYIKSNKDDYHCFVFIPYMFGTTYWGVAACPDKAVLIPCFHDESYVYLQSFKKMYSKVAGMIFNAKPENELAERVYDLSGVKTAVVGLGLDTDMDFDADRFRTKYGIKDKFILYAGRKDEGKNIYTLLNYFEKYKKLHSHNNNNLKLVLIGGGEVSVPSGIRQDVYDLGFVDTQDKYDAYGAATLLCQPSVNESFSFVIMESWLSKRPVLVHEDCAVTKNFVIESNGGLYFKSYYDFEGTVDYILENTKTAAVMGENGRDYVLTHFAWDVIVQRYKEFFEELM